MDFEELALINELREIGGTLFSPARHKVVEHSAWLGSVKCRAREGGFKLWDSLFLYHHTRVGTFVLAYWSPETLGGAKVMVELIVMDGHPDHDPRKGGASELPTVDHLMYRLKPAFENAEFIVENLKEEHRRWIANRAARQEETKDAAKVLRKKLGAKGEMTAHMIETGQVPWVSERTADDRGYIKDQILK